MSLSKSRFVRFWTESDFRVNAGPPGSEQIAVGGDGGDGSFGGNGTPGDNSTPPGDGGLGGLGGLGGDASVDGSALKFGRPHPLGTWLDSATGGNGGDGGNGGNAGTFPAGHDYHVQYAFGGDGGHGGDAGDGSASVTNRTVYGLTGAGNGINLTIKGFGGIAGYGGSGGRADGVAGSTSAGGNGGFGGDGGDGGNSEAVLTDSTLTHVTNADDPNHFAMALTMTARGGDAGDGGHGGKGGAGSTPGAGGNGGFGADGGDAALLVQNVTFAMQHSGGGASQLTLNLSAHGGDGGDGGAAGNPGGTPGQGGIGGDSGITFNLNEITGGSENDTVRLGFHVTAGQGGVSGDGVFHALNGGGGVEASNNVINAAGGHNVLLFSWANGVTNVAVNVDLNAHTLEIGGSSSTLLHFQAVTGGSRADTLNGDAGANALDGAAGSDFLQGRLGADTLTGGAGRDSFIFIAAADSTGAKHDTITDLNFDQDFVGVDFDVAHVDAAIGGATINAATFDQDVRAAVQGLKVEHAVLVTATHGTLHGHTFLVIEANGVMGYHGGNDLVIDVTGATGTLTLDTFYNAH